MKAHIEKEKNTYHSRTARLRKHVRATDSLVVDPSSVISGSYVYTNTLIKIPITNPSIAEQVIVIRKLRLMHIMASKNRLRVNEEQTNIAPIAPDTGAQGLR